MLLLPFTSPIGWSTRSVLPRGRGPCWGWRRGGDAG